MHIHGQMLFRKGMVLFGMATLFSGAFLSAKKAVLVDLAVLCPGIKLDVRYATSNNFTKQPVYDAPRCFLHQDAAHALVKVQAELAKQGLGLLMWDAYRPLAAQWKLWNSVPEILDGLPRSHYVADPNNGGRHTRGTAVDVTMVELQTGLPVEMPTDFDNFTRLAHTDNMECSVTAQKNRALLQQEMDKVGFEGYSGEWWHFDWTSWKEYDPLDVSFAQLDEIAKINIDKDSAQQRNLK